MTETATQKKYRHEMTIRERILAGPKSAANYDQREVVEQTIICRFVAWEKFIDHTVGEVKERHNYFTDFEGERVIEGIGRRTATEEIEALVKLLKERQAATEEFIEGNKDENGKVRMPYGQSNEYLYAGSHIMELEHILERRARARAKQSNSTKRNSDTRKNAPSKIVERVEEFEQEIIAHFVKQAEGERSLKRRMIENGTSYYYRNTKTLTVNDILGYAFTGYGGYEFETALGHLIDDVVAEEMGCSEDDAPESTWNERYDRARALRCAFSSKRSAQRIYNALAKTDVWYKSGEVRRGKDVRCLRVETDDIR